MIFLSFSFFKTSTTILLELPLPNGFSQLFNDKFGNNYYTLDASNEISEIQKELIKIVKKA